MKYLIIFFSLSIFVYAINAQSLYQKKIIEGSDGYSIINTRDGGYVAAGDLGGHCFIMKLDSEGNQLWSRIISGTMHESVSSIIQTIDGGYAAVGSTQSFDAGGVILYFIKLDSSGILQFSRTIGGNGRKVEGYYNEGASSIIQTPDQGYLVTGTTSWATKNADCFIMKLNVNAELEWSQTVGGSDVEVSSSIVLTNDNGFIIAGNTKSFGSGNNDYFIVKFNSNTELEWCRTIGDTSDEVAYSIIQTKDGYVIAGTTSSFGPGSYASYIVKLDETGNLLWSKAIGDTSGESAHCIKKTTDDGYVIAGGFGSSGSRIGGYILKLNYNGDIVWNRTTDVKIYGRFSSIIQMKENYICTGFDYNEELKYANLTITKFDSSGYTCGLTSNPSTISVNVGTLGYPAPIVTVVYPIVTTVSSVTSIGGTLITLCTENSQKQ